MIFNDESAWNAMFMSRQKHVIAVLFKKGGPKSNLKTEDFDAAVEARIMRIIWLESRAIRVGVSL